MILQALRDSFQDRMVFTTDLDSRLLHPVVNRYTRNLIVASSLPLALGDDLQCGIPPFRDSYQTAMFLAARYAASRMRTEGQGDGGGCRSVNTTELEGRIGDAISHPLLYEIGRDGLVELAAATRPATATGGGGVYLDQPIQRAFRDAHAANAHYALSWDVNGTQWGRVALGLPAENITL